MCWTLGGQANQGLISSPVLSLSDVASLLRTLQRLPFFMLKKLGTVLRRAASRPRPRMASTSRNGDGDEAREPLFAPGAQEAEQGGEPGVIADGEFVSEVHYSQRTPWLRAGALYALSLSGYMHLNLFPPVSPIFLHIIMCYLFVLQRCSARMMDWCALCYIQLVDCCCQGSRSALGRLGQDFAVYASKCLTNLAKWLRLRWSKGHAVGSLCVIGSMRHVDGRECRQLSN